MIPRNLYPPPLMMAAHSQADHTPYTGRNPGRDGPSSRPIGLGQSKIGPDVLPLHKLSSKMMSATTPLHLERKFSSDIRAPSRFRPTRQVEEGICSTSGVVKSVCSLSPTRPGEMHGLQSNSCENGLPGDSSKMLSHSITRHKSRGTSWKISLSVSEAPTICPAVELSHS